VLPPVNGFGYPRFLDQAYDQDVGRAWTVATYADQIAGTIFRDHQIFDPHAVALGNIEVVFVDKARSLAHAQRHQAHLGRLRSQFR